MYNEKHNLAYPAKMGRATNVSEQRVTALRTEDLIPHERVVVTLSDRGFIKRVPSHTYAAQQRGGKGVIGMVTRENDAVRLLTVADTHDNLLFFTNRGKVFRTRCYEIPRDGSRTTKGTAVVNLFPIAEGEKIMAMIPVAEMKPEVSLVMATRQGEVKKTHSNNFASVRSNGLIAMDLEKGDELAGTCLTTDQDDILLVTQKGKSIKFPVASLRSSSRTSGGVRGIRLAPDDQVIGMDVVCPGAFLLIVTTNGSGKLTRVEEYPRQHRAGAGVRTFKVTDKTGEVVAARLVTLAQQLIISSADGIVINTPVRQKDPRQGIPIRRRTTQGVRLMRPEKGDKVVAIAVFD